MSDHAHAYVLIPPDEDESCDKCGAPFPENLCTQCCHLECAECIAKALHKIRIETRPQ